MNKKSITKRWSVIRKSTGNVVRSFVTRDAARDYKRGHATMGMFDNVRQVAVR